MQDTRLMIDNDNDDDDDELACVLASLILCASIMKPTPLQAASEEAMRSDQVKASAFNSSATLAFQSHHCLFLAYKAPAVSPFYSLLSLLNILRFALFVRLHT